MVVVRGTFTSGFAVCPGYGSLVPDTEAGHKTKWVGAGGRSLVAMPPPSEEAEALGNFYNDIQINVRLHTKLRITMCVDILE